MQELWLWLIFDQAMNLRRFEMTRRLGPLLRGARYCGNRAKKEVHDLDNEKSQCRIDEVMTAGRAVPFFTLREVHETGYDNCSYCIGNSAR